MLIILRLIFFVWVCKMQNNPKIFLKKTGEKFESVSLETFLFANVQ